MEMPTHKTPLIKEIPPRIEQHCQSSISFNACWVGYQKIAAKAGVQVDLWLFIWFLLQRGFSRLSLSIAA